MVTVGDGRGVGIGGDVGGGCGGGGDVLIVVAVVAIVADVFVVAAFYDSVLYAFMNLCMSVRILCRSVCLFFCLPTCQHACMCVLSVRPFVRLPVTASEA